MILVYYYQARCFDNNKIILTNHVKKQKKSCGADRDRTCDPRVANAMLSQLSYSPLNKGIYCNSLKWVWVDSNYRPPPYQSGALTN